MIDEILYYITITNIINENRQGEDQSTKKKVHHLKIKDTVL